MNEKLIFCNTGWMDFYKGIKGDAITGGGKHVDNEGWGGEIGRSILLTNHCKITHILLIEC